MKKCSKCGSKLVVMQEGGIEKPIQVLGCQRCEIVFLSFGDVLAIFDEKRKAWVCTTCGTDIKAKKVTHTEQGKTFDEDVPYCPKCEPEPGCCGKCKH